jgi:hypothetical protein
MTLFQRYIVFSTLMACAITGCQTTERSPSPPTISDAVRYTGNPPTLIFIPFPNDATVETSGYRAQIASPPRRDYTTNRIQVRVGGEVVSSGIVRLYPGSTVLQAICSAGGFTPFALPTRLYIIKSSGQRVKIYLRSRPMADSSFKLAWYDTKKDADSGSDYVLDSGDEIEVEKTVF